MRSGWRAETSGRGEPFRATQRVDSSGPRGKLGRMPPVLPPPPQPVPRGPLSILLRLVLGLIALAVPVAGFWLAAATGLSAGLDLWPALGAAGALALLLPLVWDVWAEVRHAAKQPQPERVVARPDRIRLRILAVNLGFLALMLFALNQTATRAILNRGDWFLGASRSPFAEEVRGALAKAAHAAHATFGDPAQPPIAAGEAGVACQATLAEGLTSASGATPPKAPRWPMPATPHPAVAGLTGTRAETIAAVGAALRAAEPDPLLRVKALHDFAIVHLRFDADALVAAATPEGGAEDPMVPPLASQTAEAVFEARRATAIGYANLLVALGDAADISIKRVDGYVRLFSDDHVAFPHAWNVVALDGAPQLIVDAARDAGTFVGRAFAPGYGTFWLFPPAEAAAWDLLADDPTERLPGGPSDIGGLLAGTALSTPAAAFGLDAAAAPHRLMTSPSVWTATLPNPRGVTLLATAWSPDDGTTAPCVPHTRDASARLRCSLGLARRWIVMLHAAPTPDDPWIPVGQWRVLQTPSRT